MKVGDVFSLPGRLASTVTIDETAYDEYDDPISWSQKVKVPARFRRFFEVLGVVPRTDLIHCRETTPDSPLAGSECVFRPQDFPPFRSARLHREPPSSMRRGSKR